MADPTSRFRTNYFHVKDVKAFNDLMAAAGFTGHHGTNWMSKDEQGQTVFGLGSATGGIFDDLYPTILLLDKYPDRQDLPIKQDKESWMMYEDRLIRWCRQEGINFDLDDNDQDELSKAFLHQLQHVVAPDDAIVLFEVGYENLRQLWAEAYILTTLYTRHITLNNTVTAALHGLRGKDFTTQMWY